MRNTKHKLFHDKTLKRLHDELNICGVVRNHFIALSMRYYRRYGKGLSYAKMSKHLTKLKKLAKYQHWHIPYSWALQNILKRLAQSFREMRTLKRGHPQFKSCRKHKGNLTFRGEQVSIEKLLDAQNHERNHPTYKIRLNGRWYRFALHREVKGQIKEVHVTRDALGDVYITLTEDYSEVIPDPKTGKAEGFDMGIKDFLTGSDGKRYTSPMFYKQNAKKLAKAQRVYSRKVKGSNNQKRERKNVARIHKKTENQRTDRHWKLAIELCQKFDILFFEDLNLNGNLKRLWGKQVSDLAFGEFIMKLKWQAKKRIRAVLKIGRWTPTTKCCCVCGHKNETLTLSDREWTCPKCDTHLDRDHNAAINILKEGVASFGLGDVRPIVLLGNQIVGYSIEASSSLLHSTNAFA